jgi:predicted secreted protein
MTKKRSFDRQVTVTARAGEALLSLGESPTTGHLWRLADLPPEVEMLGTEFRPAPTERLGAPGERRFRLRSRSSGTFRFAAELARGDEPAGYRVEVTLLAGDDRSESRTGQSATP